MNVFFNPEGWSDYISWAGDRKTLTRINRLIREGFRDPSSGIGEPEPLKYELQGYWSRRINEKDRLVYRVADDTIWIIQARGHY